jgi:hypothetical protein
MTHIANCMRRTFDKPDTVYIMEETPTPPIVSPNINSPCVELGALRPNCGPLTTCQSGNTISEPSEKLDKTEQLVVGRSQQSFKYQLWPRPSKAAQSFAPTLLTEKNMALAMGRSPTSLSDTLVNFEKNTTFWRRGGSLSNRRKISVPELSSNAKMVTVQETAMDSRMCLLPL